MKLPLTMSAATRRLNPQLAVEPAKKMKMQLHQARASKLEDRFLNEKLLDCGNDIFIQRQFRVRVSAWDAIVPVHYTADFAVWKYVVGGAWRCDLIEVKDIRRKPHSDELTRPKLARLMNPWISGVILETWDGEQWSTRTIA